MKKEVQNDNVLYTIIWSKIYPYDKYRASMILPEMPGLICLIGKAINMEPKCLLFYSCWRDGLRNGLRFFLNPLYTRLPEILKQIDVKNLYFKYSVIDTNFKDLKDIMYWLILQYEPSFNSIDLFDDSKRYAYINVREMVEENGEIKTLFSLFEL